MSRRYWKRLYRKNDNPLDTLIEAVRNTAKYRAVCEDMLRRIGGHELAVRRNLREAVKATKNTLHQVAGAYLPGRMRYEAWIEALEDCRRDPECLRETCRRIMGHHASTRERLPILDAFYPAVFSVLPPVRSLLDVACGLNPLAVPWMPLPADATVYAYDIFIDQTAFLNRFFEIAGLNGQAETRDIAANLPEQQADAALVLKTLPLLDHLRYADGPAFLEKLDVAYLIVSFPVKSLGGQEKGMMRQYESRFMALADARGWRVTRFAFATELVFVAEK